MQRIFLILLSVFSFISLNARDEYKFRTLSPDGGFYYDGVKSIQQDKDGFIWASINNDLFRFDGYTYKSHSSQFKDIDPNVQWDFNDISVDEEGRLLVSTNKGLFLKANTNHFEKILDSANLGRIYKDHDKNIWVGKGANLYLFNGDSLKTVLVDDKPLKNINSFDSNEKYFIASSVYGDIYFYNRDFGEFKHALKLTAYIRSVKISGDNIWALTNLGLYKINAETSEVVKFYDIFENNQTKTFLVDRNGLIWAGTQNGLYVFDPKTEKHNVYHHSKTDPFSLPNNSIWVLKKDNNDNIWIGTYSGGLCYVNIDEKSRFKNYTTSNTQLNHNLISGFAEYGDDLWIATEGEGLNKLNLKTEKFSYYKNNGGSNSLAYNNVKSLVVDNNDNLWVSMFRGGINSYNLKTEQLNRLSTADGLVTNDLRKVILEADSGIWIAYQFASLVISYYSFENNTFTHYKPGVAAFVFDILKDGNYLWIVTHENIYKLDVRTKELDKVGLNLPFYPNTQTIAVRNNSIWLGTIDNGLIEYNVKTKKTEIFDFILKMGVTSIYSLCFDDEGYLWAGTDNGLFRYDIENDQFFKFDKMDGIQGQVFYPLSSMKSKSGKLYFGGTNGFTIVDPSRIEVNDIKPKVIISDFFVDNVSKYDKLEENITLNHNQINFGFNFSSDNYLMPQKNTYKYRLKGYDNDWILVNANARDAFYSKVPPGKYTFEVFAANNDGVWGDTPVSITINRLPAPWFSWPAYLLYALLIVGISFRILKYYDNQKKLKLQIYLDKLELDKKEEIHQTQLSFFTNISHDFKTPLSLIIAALEKLKQEGIKDYYYRILNSNSQRLLNLVNELMDFRTVENGKIELNLQPVDINGFIKEIASDFTDYAKQRNIKFDVKKELKLTSLLLDKQIMEKIVMNLINNSFKYTNEGGDVTIRAYHNPSEFVSKYSNSFTIGDKNIDAPFSIVVSDTGIGISKESIESVFERFYKVNTVNFDSHLGTGIGLALVRSLVLLHKGSVTIYSEREKGTDMVVTFSTNPNIYYKGNEVKKEIEQNVEVIDSNIEHKETTENLLLRNKKRILFAEDNDDLRILLADVLSSEYEVIEASNGVIATNLLEEMEVDLIISDIMMPEKDGITLCREVKENINTSHIPFILLTAKTGVYSKIEGADSGADIYFEKPIDPNLLQITIRNIFKQQQTLKDHFSKNYFVDASELSTNKQDNKFLESLIEVIDKNIDQTDLDVNYVASELSMSRSKLYSKIKKMTDKSIVEFILSYRLRVAAKLIVEENLSMREVMERIGIESQSYFTRSFKKEFGETPTAFSSKYKNK